jgi:gluconolactonase
MMITRRNFLLATSATMAITSCKPNSLKTPATMIESMDRRLNEIIAPDSRIETLSSGYGWSEGPVWDPVRNCLYFNDVPGNTTWRWSDDEGASEFLNPSGAPAQETVGFREPGANGLWIAKDGTLLICNHGRRAIERMNLDTLTREDVASSYDGKRFNSPNDIVEGSDGALYFTDPPYGLAGLDASPLKEQDANGVYRVAPTGEITRILSDMTFPNGIALSPDATVLYVSQSDPEAPVLRACAPDGHGIRTLFDFSPYMGEESPGLPDGMAISDEGLIFQTGPGGVFILTPQGEVLGRIQTGKATANCCFGGKDGKTLYMTAHDTLMRVRLKVRGLSR